MLVMIKSAPDSPEGKRGVELARDMAAEIVLLQNGVYLTQGQKLEAFEFAGRAYAVEDDMRLRGLSLGDSKCIQEINYDDLVDLIIKNEKVVGMF